VFTEYPYEGIMFFLGFVRLCYTPPRFFRYVMEPKGFLMYPNRGIACALQKFRHKQYPSNILDQSNSIHGVYKIPSWGYCFLSRFEFLIFGGKERFFGLNARLELIFLIISSSIHIRVCENVFLIIYTRWCKMKEKCFK